MVRLFNREKAAQALKKLEYWQALERLNWPGHPLSLLVMTGEIPADYPAEMSTCIVCRKGYKIWQSIIAGAGCNHSFHAECEGRNGICPNGSEL